MLNNVVLIGRLATDPDLKYTQSGIAVANFRLAVERPFSNKDGERETDFFTVVCWRKLAETVGEYLDKGRLVGVKGRLQVSQWEQDGQKRERVEVVADEVRFLDGKRERESGSQDEVASEFGGEEVPF